MLLLVFVVAQPYSAVPGVEGVIEGHSFKT